MTKRIAILGDFNPAFTTHHALNDSLNHVQQVFSENIAFDWIATDVFDFRAAFKNGYYGLWIAPGSPYKDPENVLNAITYTRENKIPTFGNCGGFQYMIIEFARNVCGITNADHEETSPDASDLLISKLSCSLVEQREQLTIGNRTSILYSIVQKESLIGRYFCNYGINGAYRDVLTSHGLIVTAESQDGQARSFELKNHPFFLGTLFQPALTSTVDAPDPLILEFVRRSLG